VRQHTAGWGNAISIYAPRSGAVNATPLRGVRRDSSRQTPCAIAHGYKRQIPCAVAHGYKRQILSATHLFITQILQPRQNFINLQISIPPIWRFGGFLQTLSIYCNAEGV